MPFPRTTETKMPFAMNTSLDATFAKCFFLHYALVQRVAKTILARSTDRKKKAKCFAKAAVRYWERNSTTRKL